MPKSGKETKQDFTVAKAGQEGQLPGPPKLKPSKQAILDGLNEKPKRRRRKSAEQKEHGRVEQQLPAPAPRARAIFGRRTRGAFFITPMLADWGILQFSISMPDKEPRPDLPQSEVVFQDTSTDGRLTITVWRDTEPETELMRELGAMGTVRVYDSYSGELYHEERMALSPGAIFGPGPNDNEVERWAHIIEQY